MPHDQGAAPAGADNPLRVLAVDHTERKASFHFVHGRPNRIEQTILCA